MDSIKETLKLKLEELKNSGKKLSVKAENVLKEAKSNPLRALAILVISLPVIAVLFWLVLSVSLFMFLVCFVLGTLAFLMAPILALTGIAVLTLMFIFEDF